MKGKQLAAGLLCGLLMIGSCSTGTQAAFEASVEAAYNTAVQEMCIRDSLSDKEIPPAQKKAFSSFTGLFGTQEILAKARELTENAQALSALDRLQEIWDILCMYGVSKYVSFDLGMLSSYMYYTGITFRGYTFGTGDAVIKGGRYDRLLHCFGKDAPAVGFVAVVDELLSALSRQKITQEIRCV